MRLKAPSFWYKPPGITSVPLVPLSCLYRAGHGLRHAVARPYKAKMPVVCIGNIVAGGSGKTPSALAVMHLIHYAALAERPCFLTRGYGGSLKGPVTVDKDRHSAQLVGDEPLLLALEAPTVVSANRKKGARYAEDRHFDLIVMDDGLQNPGLEKDISFVVIDGATGFGNGRVLPAGPMRERAGAGLGKADAFILIGNDRHNVRASLPAGKPVFAATLEVSNEWIKDGDSIHVAFCGIAHPDKFRQTLASADINVAAFHAFPDHYNFLPDDLERLADDAAGRKARLITTAKDAARLPADFTRRHIVDVLPVQLGWDNEVAVIDFLKTRLARA